MRSWKGTIAGLPTIINFANPFAAKILCSRFSLGARIKGGLLQQDMSLEWLKGQHQRPQNHGKQEWARKTNRPQSRLTCLE